jgi:hypothetical protein
MNTRYPRAVDLAQIPHCSVCGETNPITDEEGGTACCGRRECGGVGPEAQDVCCQALQDRVDHESAHGTPASPLSAARPVAAAPRRARTRSTRIKETRDLLTLSDVCKSDVTPGDGQPPTTEPKEAPMALSTTAATSAVCRNLFKDGPNSFEPVGGTFGTDREIYESLAKAYLKDKTDLSGSTIEAADWDEVFATFQPDPAPAAEAAPQLAAGSRVTTTGQPALTPTGYVVSVQYDPPFAHLAASGGADHLVRDLAPAPAEAATPAPAPAPAPKGARKPLGDASAPGWELLYDKPKAGAEVGRRYVDGKPQFSLICKAHGHVHKLDRLSDEGKVRKAGGWCPSC